MKGQRLTRFVGRSGTDRRGPTLHRLERRVFQDCRIRSLGEGRRDVYRREDDPEGLRVGSVRITGGNFMDTVQAIEDVWKRVIPNYPMQGEFLNATFDQVYNILKFMNMALGGFATVALSLAMIGLFGLAAFMAAQRTKEIGIRKVLGASSGQIAMLLVWQFSKPVMWALVIALPAAFFASNVYLDFFAERIEWPIAILLVAGAVAVMLAWSTVAGHAYRIARANPILALRYE